MVEETHAAGRGSVASDGFRALLAAHALGVFADAFALVLFLVACERERDFAWTSVLPAVAAAWLGVSALLSPWATGLVSPRSRRALLAGAHAAGVLAFLVLGVGLAFGNLPVAACGLALLAGRSALARPARQGLLPDLLSPGDLARGGGVLHSAAAALLAAGAVGAGIMSQGVGPGASAAAGAAASGIALLAALRVPVPATGPGGSASPLSSIQAGVSVLLGSRTLCLTTLGLACSWICASLLGVNLLAYGPAMGLGPLRTATLLIASLLGLGMGCALAGSLSKGKVELGLVPVGALGIAVLTFLLFWTPRIPFAFEVTVACLALLGLAGGLFFLPIEALLERVPAADSRGATLAAAGLISVLCGGLGFAVHWILRDAFRFDPAQVFLVTGIATAAGTIFALTVLPDQLARLILWIATNLVYKVRVVGGENLPSSGPALLVANHISYVDGLIILASTPRFIRFVVHKEIASLPFLRHLGKVMGVIPISPDDGPRSVVKALKEAGDRLAKGDLVCIFAEGQISRTGQLLPFRGGAERILKHHPAPIIPAHLDQVWGSIFSFAGGRFFWKLPKRVPYVVTVSFGKPLPAETPMEAVRLAVQDLASEAVPLRKAEELPLPWLFLRYARHHPFRLAMVDSTGKKASFGKLAAGVVGLAKVLGGVWKDEEFAGILLPPSVAGAAVNAAASLLGKPTVNLNYTASREAIRSAIEQCGIKNVVSSRAFLERVKIEMPANVVFLEDLAGKRRGLSRLADLFAALFLPPTLLTRSIGGKEVGVDDVATVIFSSGSTGDPKGVMLSHFNIISNIQSVSQVLDLNASQRILGILPFFHATGYTGGLWAPLLTGVRAVYHVNPLDARTVGELVKRHGVTILFATPTFIQGYARRCDPGDFGSLKFVIVGAEKLTAAIAESFARHFGIEPMEGYGCTEASPMIAVNVPDFRAPGMFQVGWKKGTVGRPLPGVSVRIVDRDTEALLPAGEEGMLLVKGPNIMKGYLRDPELTARVIKDGWYSTGDIARVDDDGFITITDRLSRFAKIGGEMVPIIKVEEALHEALGISDQAFSVTSVPDAAKGERLAVIHTLPDEKLDELFEKLPRWDLPNLWVPRRDVFQRVEEIPRLATGKVDLKKVREIVEGAEARA